MTGRVAFVTSGANGLGYTVVESLLTAGWDVFFTYKSSEESAQLLVEYARQLGRQAVCFQADLLSETETVAAAEHCLQTMKRVDALIHNFGPFVFERVTVADYSMDKWNDMFDGNIRNFVWLYQQFIHPMRARKFGRIVTVGFDGAGSAVGWRYRGPYAAAKSALASLTRSIAIEERSHGITANMVCPGDIRGKHKLQRIKDVASESGKRPPVGEDVARVVTFLCNPSSGQLNGTVTEVNGGFDTLHTNGKH